MEYCSGFLLVPWEGGGSFQNENHILVVGITLTPKAENHW